MDSPHTIGLFRGPQITPWLEQVADLRISVFKDWPYLYEGEHAYEGDYLAAYARSADSLFVLAFADGEVVGASTGLPLQDETASFRQPFTDCDFAAESVFYFGESVLLPAYRGHGIGHAFFDHREAHARALGRFQWTSFCAVDRAPDDSRKPAEHRVNDAFWQKRGYARQPSMTMHLPWEEVGRGEVIHPLTFWMRPLEASI